MKQKPEFESGSGEEKAAAIIDTDGQYVGCNEAAEQLTGYSEEEIIGMEIGTLSTCSDIKTGRIFERMLHKEVEFQIGFERKSGEQFTGHVKGKPFDVGDSLVQITFEPIEDEPKMDDCVSSMDIFEKMDRSRIKEIGDNIRVDMPSGKMTLNEIMSDLAVAHKEIEQYRKGALTTLLALDDRLVEERKYNRGSDEAAAIREVREMAEQLYEKMQNGAI